MIENSYGSRLQAAVARYGRLCVGIDPHPAVLDGWGLPPDVHGLDRCARTMIEAVAGRVAVIKPQSAFFEAYGSAGIAVLERVLADARAAGLITLLDVKRGDIGSTMAAYTQAYLGDDSPLAADAITLNPYLGPAALDGAVDQARSTGRGIYLLAATSNPQAGAVQQAVTPQGATISQSIIDAANAYNHVAAGSAGARTDDGWNSVGVVIGATLATEVAAALDLTQVTGSILVPGLGAQGATADDLRRVFQDRYSRLLPTSSRAILTAGPRIDSIRAAVARVQADLG